MTSAASLATHSDEEAADVNVDGCEDDGCEADGCEDDGCEIAR